MCGAYAVSDVEDSESVVGSSSKPDGADGGTGFVVSQRGPTGGALEKNPRLVARTLSLEVVLEIYVGEHFLLLPEADGRLAGGRLMGVSSYKLHKCFDGGLCAARSGGNRNDLSQ